MPLTPADSPITYTLTTKAETLLGRPVFRRSPCEKHMLAVRELVLRKPELASPASQVRTARAPTRRYPNRAYTLRGQVRMLNRRLVEFRFNV